MQWWAPPKGLSKGSMARDGHGKTGLGNERWNAQPKGRMSVSCSMPGQVMAPFSGNSEITADVRTPSYPKRLTFCRFL